MTQLEIKPPRLDKSLANKLARVEAPSYLLNNEMRGEDPYKGTRNFQQFISGFLIRAAQAVEQYQRDLRSNEGSAKEPRLVLIYNSLPGSGKTYYGELVDRFILNWLKGCFPDQKDERLYSRRSWETDGKQAAYSAGEIQTSYNDPATSHELFAATNRLAENISHSVSSSFITKVELAGAAAFLKDPTAENHFDRWEGKMLGNEAIRDLSLGQGRYFNGIRDEYNLELHGAALIAGPRLDIMQDYRGKIKIAKNLTEAIRVCKMFGKVPPTDLDQLKAIQREGASPEQMIGIVREARRLMGILESQNKLGIPYEEQLKFGGEYDTNVTAEVGLERRHFASTVYIIGELLHYIMTKDYELEGETTFIGVNDPSWKELRAKKTSLKNFYARQQGFTDIEGRAA